MMYLLKYKLIYTTYIFSLLSIHTAFSQNYFKFTPDIKRENQSKLFYNKPGSYEIAAVLDKADVSKGEHIKINLFFTGYGIIESPKLSIYPSSSILNSESKIFTSYIKKVDSSISWGRDSVTFDDSYVIFLSSGVTYIKNGDSIKYTIFMDNHNEGISNFIYSESSSSNKGPVSIDLKIKDNSDPGEYKIKLYLSYFNGEEWKSSQTAVEFRVNNLVEDYPVRFALLGLLFAFLALLGDAIKGVKILINFIRLPFRKHKKMPPPEGLDGNNDSRTIENNIAAGNRRKRKR